MTVSGEPSWHQRAGFDVQEFSANGIRTFAVVEGRRDLFPVIFLHGFPGGAFLWEYIIAALGRRRLAIAPDYPGWGRSVSHHANLLPPPSPEWSLQWLIGLLAAQGIERFDLAAHGSGSWLALEILAAQPARIRRLVLISSRLWPHRQLFGRFHRTWTAPRIQRWLERRAMFSLEAQNRHVQEFSQLAGEEHFPLILRENEFIAHFESYHRALSEFRRRTLLIWGENDPAYSFRQSEELANTLDRPEVHRIANAGHYPMLDQPQLVTTILKESLEE